MILTATGHRPDKLGGYSKDVEERLYRLAYSYLKETKPSRVITGMALGWDMAVAEACIVLGIPFTAAIPFEGQETKWPLASQERYHFLLSYAAEQIIVCDGFYEAWKLLKRDEWMVDQGDKVIALWNGSKGGTGHTVKYAQTKGKEVVNLWERWTQHDSSDKPRTERTSNPA